MIGNPAVDPLIDSLKDENFEVRKSAIKALEKIGDPRAVQPLIDSLKDESSDIRESAIWALRMIGDPRAVQPLIDFYGDNINKSNKDYAYRALERITKTNILPYDQKKMQKWWNKNKKDFLKRD